MIFSKISHPHLFVPNKKLHRVLDSIAYVLLEDLYPSLKNIKSSFKKLLRDFVSLILLWKFQTTCVKCGFNYVTNTALL